MKNQNDIIFSSVAIVFALIVAAVSFFTKPEPQRPANPAPIDQRLPDLPAGQVVMADQLPGGGQAAGGPGGGGGRGGSPFGPGGPGGGRGAGGGDSSVVGVTSSGASTSR